MDIPGKQDFKWKHLYSDDKKKGKKFLDYFRNINPQFGMDTEFQEMIDLREREDDPNFFVVYGYGCGYIVPCKRVILPFVNLSDAQCSKNKKLFDPFGTLSKDDN